MTLTLVRPSQEHQESFLAALSEYHAEGRYVELSAEKLSQDFARFVQGLLAQEQLAAQMIVPMSVFWLIEDGVFIGRVSVRHYLNDWLLRVGGNIGYDIRPSQRNRGYGTKILQLALSEAKRLGLERALLTCDDNNEGSIKIIEKNGGVLESIEVIDGLPQPKRRYWIDLSSK